MHTKIFACFLSIICCSVFAAGANKDPEAAAADAALAANRATAEARVADPSAAKPKNKAEAQKAAATKKADLQEYKAMVAENKDNIKALFEKAEAAWKAKDYKQAGMFYQSVSQATAPGTEEMVDTSLQRINVDMEVLAKEHITASDDAGLQRDIAKQVEELAFVVKGFGITKAGQDAIRRMTALKQRAEVAAFVEYAQAEQLLADNKLSEAMTQLNGIITNPRYEHSIPALRAARKIEELNKDDNTRGRLKADFTAKADKEAPHLLAAANNFIENNMPKKAIEKLDLVLEKYPDTPYAQEAKKRLEALK